MTHHDRKYPNSPAATAILHRIQPSNTIFSSYPSQPIISPLRFHRSLSLPIAPLCLSARLCPCLCVVLCPLSVPLFLCPSVPLSHRARQIWLFTAKLRYVDHVPGRQQARVRNNERPRKQHNQRHQHVFHQEGRPRRGICETLFRGRRLASVDNEDVSHAARNVLFVLIR